MSLERTVPIHIQYDGKREDERALLCVLKNCNPDLEGVEMGEPTWDSQRGNRRKGSSFLYIYF